MIENNLNPSSKAEKCAGELAVPFSEIGNQNLRSILLNLFKLFGLNDRTHYTAISNPFHKIIFNLSIFILSIFVRMYVKSKIKCFLILNESSFLDKNIRNL